MTRQEKLDLKQSINSFIGNLFESQQKELLATYPFIQFNDNDIEDDAVDLPEPDINIETAVFGRMTKISDEHGRSLYNLSYDTFGDSYLIQRIGDSAVGIERGRGFILKNGRSDTGDNIQFYFRCFTNISGKKCIAIVPAKESGHEYMKSIGYYKLSNELLQRAEDNSLEFYQETMPEFYRQLMEKAKQELAISQPF